MSRIVGLVIVALLLVGCGGDVSSEPPDAIELRTQVGEPQACAAALMQGMLVADPATGVAITDPAGFVRPVIWPHGYVAHAGNPITVVDSAGTVVARVGDTVAIGGGEVSSDGAWLACGGITVTDVAS